MVTAQHIERLQHFVPAAELPFRSQILARDAQPITQAITLVLDSVMFTGRVPLSTWTFTLSVADKLWVSGLKTLYFGKETRINRPIYAATVPMQDHRILLDVGVAVYNNYGDILKTQRAMRFYELGSEVNSSALLPVSQNWMQLLFKFRLVVHAAESV